MTRGIYNPRNEYHGPAYELVPSLQKQEGEPRASQAGRHPHGVPGNLHPPFIAILAGAPRTLSVSQRVREAAPEDRLDAFLDAVGFAHGVSDVLAEDFHDRNYHDRRGEDRPPRADGWQRDVDPARYLTY